MAEQVTEDAEYAARRRRIRRLKRMIILLLVTSILIPIILCVILFWRTQELQEQIFELQKLVENRQQEDFESEENIEVEKTISETQIVPNVYTAGDADTKEAELLQDSGRKIYLTFDDGPSCYTDEILDILAEYDVKATFFVVGKTDEASLEAYKRIVDEGHTLGMHSYSHRYHEIYRSVEAYAADLSLLQELLYEETGVWSRYVRFPGGSSNKVSKVDMQEFITYLENQEIQFFDWNISTGDAAAGYVSAQSIVDNAIRNVEEYSTAIILMHDASDKKTTVEALPIIIEKLLALEDASLQAIDENTKLIQHIKATK